MTTLKEFEEALREQGMNMALAVLEKLREDERTHLVPVILFSSSNKHKDVVKGYELGANSYVTKPANFDEFSEAMQYLGWYWLNFNESP